MRFFTAVTVGFLIISLSIQATAQFSNENVCDITAETLSLYLATSYISKAPTKHPVFPIAINDILCETNENMANIALMARKENSDEYFYGIFHIHFHKDGKIISSVPIYDWITVRGFKDPLVLSTWCNFIRNVYPTEPKQQGCRD